MKSKIVKLIEAEIRRMVVKGWKERDTEVLVKGYKVSVYKMNHPRSLLYSIVSNDVLETQKFGQRLELMVNILITYTQK